MNATESAPSTKFEQWAIVEIFGHQKYAGLVTEESLGGTNMVRVDIPETPRNQKFTKFFGGAAIFSLTPVGEEIARAMAENMDLRPPRGGPRPCLPTSKGRFAGAGGSRGGRAG